MASTKTVEQTKLDYFMDVLLRNYCRTMEENEILYEEANDMKEAMGVLFQENADMRHILTSNGFDVPMSSFVSAEESAEIETLSRI